MRLVIPRELKGTEVANLLYLEELVSLSVFFIFYVFTSFFFLFATKFYSLYGIVNMRLFSYLIPLTHLLFFVDGIIGMRSSWLSKRLSFLYDK